MNSNVYVFGKFGKEYTQYPNDYTKDVYQKFLYGASAQSQMIIHRDGDLMYYGYIRHLDTAGHFIGFSVVLNGVMVCNTDVLFEIFEFAVSELISRNEILTLSYDNVLLPCIEQLSEKAEEVERISVIIQDQLVELESDMSRLPTATVGPASNSYIKYKYGDDVSVIAKSSMQYGFTYVYKNFDNIAVVNQPTNVISPVYYEGNDDNRTRKWLYGVIVLLLAVIGGGGYWWYSQTEEEREVQDFVERFAKAVELGDNNLLHQLYPNAENAESLHVTYHKDSVAITHMDGNDTIDVKLSHLQSLRLVNDVATKKMYVVSSKGIFTFPKEDVEFAMKTGWINGSLDDVEKAKRLKDKDFIPWIEKKAIEVMKANVKVVKSSLKEGEILYGEGNTDVIAVNYSVVVENKNNCDISGNAYIVKVEEKGIIYTWWPYEETEESYTESLQGLTGKTIPSKGTVSYSWVGSRVAGGHSGNRPQKLVSKVILNISEQEAIAAYEPNGTEYEEFLESKNIK